MDLTDGSGTVTDQYTYDAFGAVRSHAGSSANYWQFTGEQSDADSGLYYLRARYYDPSAGRFLGKDPLPIGNRYSYVSNNPVSYVDPYGLWPDLPDVTPDFVDDIVDDVVDDIVSPIGDVLSGDWTGAILDIPGLVSYIDVVPIPDPILSTITDWSAFVLTEISLFVKCNGWEFWVGTGLNTANLGVGVYGVMLAGSVPSGGSVVAVYAAVVAAEFTLTYAAGEVLDRCAVQPVYGGVNHGSGKE